MKNLKGYHLEFVKPLILSFSLLNKLNIRLFDDNRSSLKRNWRFLYLVPLLVVFNVSIALYMCKVLSNPVGISEITYTIAVFLVSIESIVKTFIILYKRRNIETLVSELGSLWRTSNLTNEQLRRKDRLMKRLKWFQSIFYWSNILGTWQQLSAPLLVVLMRRFLLKQDCELKLPFGAVYPYEPTGSWLMYLPTYAFQTFIILKKVYVYVGSEFLMITLCADLAIEFSMIREDLVHVSPTFQSFTVNTGTTFETQQNSDTYISISIQDLIQQHQKLIGLAKQLDGVFNLMVFVNLIFINFNICFFGFSAAVAQGAAETAHNSIGVFAMLLPTYIFCYYGELLKEESLGIAESAYINQWYKGDVRYQKIIKFIISRSQRPCCMTAIGHVPVTLNTFTKVLSTTWSYFSLLTSVYLNDE